MNLERTANTGDGDTGAMESANSDTKVQADEGRSTDCMGTIKSTIHYGRHGNIVLWLGPVNLDNVSSPIGDTPCPATEIPSPKPLRAMK